MIHQIGSLAGALLILSAYVLNQRGVIGPWHRMYSGMNLVGSLLLLWIAIVDQRWGFILLESAWALASIPPLLNPPPAPAGGVSDFDRSTSTSDPSS